MTRASLSHRRVSAPSLFDPIERCATYGCRADLTQCCWEAVTESGKIVRVCPVCARKHERKRQVPRT